LCLSGGHLGRFIVWTKSAFEKLDLIFGNYDKKSLVKKNYTLPRPIMSNPDLARIINSDEIQSVVRPVKQEIKRRVLKKNPLKNLGALLKLNPYAKTARRMELLAQEQRAKAKAEKLDSKRKISKVWLSLGIFLSVSFCNICISLSCIDRICILFH
jgi:large subunit ribosomal protein L4e